LHIIIIINIWRQRGYHCPSKRSSKPSKVPTYWYSISFHSDIAK